MRSTYFGPKPQRRMPADLSFPMLLGTRHSRRASTGLDERFAAAHRALGEVAAPAFSLPNLFDKRFGRLAEPMDAPTCAIALCEHHEAIQREKSAAGKRPWFDRIGGNRIYIRQAYRVSMPEMASAQYLHTYRGKPIRHFRADLT